MIISSTPDLFKFGSMEVNTLGPRWLEGTVPYWRQIKETPPIDLVLDLSKINFATLFDWICVVAMIERVLSNPNIRTLSFDLVGENVPNVIPAADYLRIKRKEKPDDDYTRADLALSDRVYLVAGFLESLGTRDVLSVGAERAHKVFYSHMKSTEVSLRSFYAGEKAKDFTSVFGLTRIFTREDCRQFLDPSSIQNWREAMERRFQDSPLFESEEIWRVLCHELAVNIWEHAKVVGFLASRVVPEPFVKGRPIPWCLATYGPALGYVFDEMQNGFIELCIADAGRGFVNTLKETYLERTKSNESDVKPEDVLVFAFDELSTCKTATQCWATERHALGRILQIVAKYGGALVLRSGGAEVIYRTTGGRFKQLPNHLGYEAQSKRQFSSGVLPGAQLQLLLPLKPLTNVSQRREARSVLDMSLPSSFHPQRDQVRGFLVPLRDQLEFYEASVGGPQQQEFWVACERLSRQLIGRPPTEPLVLDFSDLNWSSEQFETLLHLLHNVLQNRPVLLVEIDPHLASEADERERQAAPTLLRQHTDAVEDIGHRIPHAVSEERFLETFSRVHAPVLGLDQDGKAYIFGILYPEYKAALLHLMTEELSIKDLCSQTYLGVRIKESHLRAILHNTNCLFELAPTNTVEELWRMTWTKLALANEASRVISRHFDKVAERCQAWRGRSAGMEDD
jgi:hypothetical protein